MARTILLILFFLSLSAPSFSADDVYVAQTGPDGVQRVELTAGSYFFRPEHIVVSVGVPVELVIRNESKIVPHNFVMDSPEAGMALSEALSEKLSVVRFTPQRRAGTRSTATGSFFSSRATGSAAWKGRSMSGSRP